MQSYISITFNGIYNNCIVGDSIGKSLSKCLPKVEFCFLKTFNKSLN
jgi:hypothetical protein